MARIVLMTHKHPEPQTLYVQGPVAPERIETPLSLFGHIVAWFKELRSKRSAK
jgi:hypothetical protein